MVKESGSSSGSGPQKPISKATEAELLELLLMNMKDYAIIMLDEAGRVISWSAAAEALIGWSTAEIIGQNVSHFYTPDDVAKDKIGMELRTAATDGRFEDEGWRVRKDGSRFWANVIVTCLRGSDGQIRGFGKVMRDLTERREAELKITRQNQEILEMAAVPVVQVWDGVVLVPLIGTLDSQRTHQLMERVLNRLIDTNSPVALLDITGVPSIDTQTAQHLVETVAAVRLIGAEIILTGVRPAIAQTLVHLGTIDLSDITTRPSLRAGLRIALERLGMRVVAKEPQA